MEAASESVQWKWNWRTRFLLRRAFKRRSIAPVPWETFEKFKPTPLACRIVDEFYRIKLPGLGLRAMSIEIDPGLADGIESILEREGAPLGVRFFPLGEVADGYGSLLLDETGMLYVSVRAEPELVSDRFDEGLERIIYGRGYYEGESWRWGRRGKLTTRDDHD